MKTIILLVAIICCTSVFAPAQSLNPAKGKVEVIQDPKLNQVSSNYKKLNLQNAPIDGFRVQIFFESGPNSKSTATAKMNSFQTLYPEVKTYLSYKEPYYRVRVGNFRTLIEAVGFQKQISDEYPNAYTVKDKITP
jgi:hypothetical protein